MIDYEPRHDMRIWDAAEEVHVKRARWKLQAMADVNDVLDVPMGRHRAVGVHRSLLHDDSEFARGLCLPASNQVWVQLLVRQRIADELEREGPWRNAGARHAIRHREETRRAALLQADPWGMWTP